MPKLGEVLGGTKTNIYCTCIHSFIPLFSVDLLQDVEIVMFLKVQEREKKIQLHIEHTCKIHIGMSK